MKQAWNIIWKVALAMGAVGIVLTLIGLKLGPPQPVAWGSQGPRVMDVRDIEVSENNLAPFDKIVVDAAILDVTVVQGDRYGLRIHAPSSFLDITWADENGTLTVTQKDTPIVMGIWFGGPWTVAITVPTGVTLTSASVSTHTGDASLAVPAAAVNLTSSTGDVKLLAPADEAIVRTNTGKARVETDVKNLTATASTGNVVVSGNCGAVKADTSTGQVTIQGSAINVDAHSSTGDVTVTLSAPWNATTYSVHTSTGSIRFAGPGAPPSDNRSSQVASPQLTLTATTSTGSIKVTLGA